MTCWKSVATALRSYAPAAPVVRNLRAGATATLSRRRTMAGVPAPLSSRSHEQAHVMAEPSGSRPRRAGPAARDQLKRK